MDAQKMLDEAYQHGDTMRIDLWYPRHEESPIKAIQIGLIDVRAAEDIRISYDYDRNGWQIEKATVFEWSTDDKVCDPCWKEVSFIPGDSTS